MSDIFHVENLRDAIINNKPIDLFKDDSKVETLTDANKIQISDKVYSLDINTNFFNETEQADLKSVMFCYFHDKSSVVDYKKDCSKFQIPDFKFLVKTELTTWLNGNSDTCKFINSSTNETITTNEVNGKKRTLEDPQISRISQFEKESVDHNMILRGSKNVDFGYLIKDAKVLINQLKRNKPSKPVSSSHANLKLPIIIISPSTSSLLSLSNIKQFLEESKFIEPTNSELSRPSNGVVVINHKSDRLAPVAHKITVVDNVDNFTKPEYWDRVIAIFTTGQSWQFTKYKQNRPELLFQRYAGFYIGYQGDMVPSQIKDWNVNEIKVNKDRRFRDKMIVKDLWFDIEKILIQRGYSA